MEHKEPRARVHDLRQAAGGQGAGGERAQGDRVRLRPLRLPPGVLEDAGARLGAVLGVGRRLPRAGEGAEERAGEEGGRRRAAAPADRPRRPRDAERGLRARGDARALQDPRRARRQDARGLHHPPRLRRPQAGRHLRHPRPPPPAREHRRGATAGRGACPPCTLRYYRENLPPVSRYRSAALPSY